MGRRFHTYHPGYVTSKRPLGSSARERVCPQTPVIYVIGFAESLTKVGRTANWARRRSELTHNGNLPLIAESAFHIDVEEDLPSVEEFVLADVRERFPRAGGNEYFRAAFDEVLLVVSAALAGGKIVHELADLPAYSAPPTDDLSEMTGDQLDAAIQRFAMDHGVSVTKVIRWLGAGEA